MPCSRKISQDRRNGCEQDTKKFPNMSALVDFGHSKGVKMGFYQNGCACGEKTEHTINYEVRKNESLRF